MTQSSLGERARRLGLASLGLVASLWVAPTLKGRLCSPSKRRPLPQK